MPRQSIKEEIKNNPFVDVLAGLGKGLTPKQKKFAEEVARGEKGSTAYRKAYNSKAKPKTIANNAYNLKSRADIQATIEAINRANEVMKYQTAEGLRSLAVSTLVDVLTNPETSQAVKVQCARTIGTMTEVSLFTHRTESKVIHSSEDIKAKILKEISSLMNSSAEDVIARDADSLLNELTAPQLTKHTESANDDEQENGDLFLTESATHPAPTPTSAQTESLAPTHTIPDPLSPSIEEDPLGLKKA